MILTQKRDRHRWAAWALVPLWFGMVQIQTPSPSPPPPPIERPSAPPADNPPIRRVPPTLTRSDKPAEPEKASRHHFAYVDYDFIFTLELVRAGTPILNFVNLGTGVFLLQAPDVRLISGIKMYRPRLFDVETANAKDPLRVSSLRVHPRSSFGITLIGEMAGVSEVDRVTIQLGAERFDLQPIGAKEFDDFSQKVGKLNLLSPDIRDDYRVLELKPMGNRKRVPR